MCIVEQSGDLVVCFGGNYRCAVVQIVNSSIS